MVENTLNSKMGIVKNSAAALDLSEHDLYLSYRETIKLYVSRDKVLESIVNNEDDSYRKRVGFVCEHYRREGILIKPVLNPEFDRCVEDLADSLNGLGIFNFSSSLYTTRGRSEIIKKKDIYSVLFSLAIAAMGAALGSMESNEYSNLAVYSTFALAGVFPFASRYLGAVDFNDLEEMAIVCDRYVDGLKSRYAL
jgi:hypothetical protein